MHHSNLMTTMIVTVLCLISSVLAAPRPLTNLFIRADNVTTTNTTSSSTPIITPPYANRTGSYGARIPWNATWYYNTTTLSATPTSSAIITVTATPYVWSNSTGGSSGPGSGSGAGSSGPGYVWSNSSLPVTYPWMNGTSTSNATASTSASATTTTGQPIKPSATNNFQPFSGGAASLERVSGLSWTVMLAVIGSLTML